MVALDEDDNVLLVRQFRKPVERELLEIPAGTLEPDEEPFSCAKRELREEVGCRAEHMEEVGTFYTSPGFCTERIHLYLAMGLIPAPSPSEEDEAIEVVKVPFAEALAMVKAGEIADAKTIIGLLTVWAKRMM